MKHTLLTTLALLAIAPSALAWPFVHRSGPGLVPPTAAKQGRALQLDQDRTLEYYRGGMEYGEITPTAAGFGTYTAVPLPPPVHVPNNLDRYYYLGRGDVGDIDGDGDVDIVYSCQASFAGVYADEEASRHTRIVACRRNSSVAWSHIYQSHVTNGPAAGAPEIKLADLDRDGDLDLIESQTSIRVMWNPGDGVFSGSTVLRSAFPHQPQIEVADFDGNGWLDLAMFADMGVVAGAGRLEVLYQDAGTFSSTTVHTYPDQATGYIETMAADLDGDGRLDLLATVNRYTGNPWYAMEWYRNTGTGFAAPVEIFAGAGELFGVQYGDMDEDGQGDIVYTLNVRDVEWRKGQGNGTFLPAAVLVAEPGLPASVARWSSLALADADGDGDTDIVRDGSFFENLTPHNQASARVTQWSGTTLSDAVDLTTGDVNNDGHTDLIAADGGANRIRWYRGGPAGLTEQLSVSTGSTVPVSVAAGDWNRDGWTDLAWSGNSILRQALSSSGTGIGWAVSDAANLPGMAGLLPADMDRDGDLDILCSSTGGVLRYFANNGDATIWNPNSVDNSVPGLSRIAVGEIVPGRRLEVAALSSNLVSTWRYGVSSWAETPLLNPAAGTASRGLCIADISDSLAGEETIFSLNSNAVSYDHDSLQFPVMLASFSSPVVQLAPVDWNRDGYSDILVTTAGSVSLLVHTPSTEAEFKSTPVVLFTATAGVTLQDAVVLDVNRDGLPDAVAADSTGELHLLTNTSHAVAYTVTPSAARGVAPEGSGEVYSFHGTCQSQVSGDAGASPAQLVLSFNRAVGSPGADVAGSPMTDAEVNALVDWFTIETTQTKGPVNVGNIIPVSMGGGQFRVTVNGDSRPAASVFPQYPDKDYTVHLRLKSSAASAPVTRFFVLLTPAITWAAVAPPGGDISSTPLRSRNDSQSSQRVLVYVRAASPLEIWRHNNFGTYETFNHAANDADPDHDGVANLVEYLTSQNPNAAGGIGNSPAVGVSFDAGISAMVPELRLLTNFDTRVKVTLQYAANPAAGWAPLSTRTGTGAWTGVTPYLTTTLGGDRSRYFFNGGFNPAVFRKAFFRLKAEELP